MEKDLNKYYIIYFDIKDYSQLSECVRMKFYDKFIKKIIEEKLNYKAINLWGDAFIAIFEKIHDMLKACDEIEWWFLKFIKNNSNNNSSIGIRVVLHYGEIGFSDISGDFTISMSMYGDSIITAARIEPLVKPNQIWCTGDVYYQWLAETKRHNATPLITQGFSQITRIGNLFLPKDHGIEELFCVKKIIEEIKEIGKEFCFVDLIKENNCIIIKDAEFVKSDSYEMIFGYDSNIINEMHQFLSDPQKNHIRTGLAIGVQNFLLKDGTLFAGIRKEGKKNKESLVHNFIGEGAFNTGYRIVTDKEFIHDEPIDFFRLIGIQRVKKNFTKENGVINLAKKKYNLKEWYIRPMLDQQYFCVIFINNSKIFPRYEIGICKFIDINALNFDRNPYYKDFGADKYAIESRKFNYWLWVSRGEIHFLSFHQINGIEGKNVLMKNNIENYKYIYTCSDEWIGNENTVSDLLSSPARSIVEVF